MGPVASNMTKQCQHFHQVFHSLKIVTQSSSEGRSMSSVATSSSMCLGMFELLPLIFDCCIWQGSHPDHFFLKIMFGSPDKNKKQIRTC